MRTQALGPPFRAVLGLRHDGRTQPAVDGRSSAQGGDRPSVAGPKELAVRPRDEGHERDGREHDAPSALDALAQGSRHAAQLAPPALPGAALTPGAPAADAPVARAMRSLEDLLPGMVRKIAWAGDARRGSVRLELGAGAYAGATIIVHAEDGRVRVEAFGREDAEVLRDRLEARLRLRGLDVD